MAALSWADHHALESFSVDVAPAQRCPVHDLQAIAPYVRLAVTPDALKANQDLADRYSADNECPHGWLPHNRQAACDCWRRVPDSG